MSNKKILERADHGFGPVYDKDSKVLILGSFPSVRSREENFYYGHPKNRFWKVLSMITGEDIPQIIEEKKRFLKKHGIALYDVIESCDIAGSSDSSIRNAVPTDISIILGSSSIKRIFTNGSAAKNYYDKFQLPSLGIEAIKLPSTSPANAAYNLVRLADSWMEVARYLK